MADCTNDGGPAFPKPLDPYPNMQEKNSGHAGMSLRDYFAGQAIVGALCNSTLTNSFWRKDGEGTTFEQEAARQAYRLADAMLQARAALHSGGRDE